MAAIHRSTLKSSQSAPGPATVVGKLLNERQLSMNQFEAGNLASVGDSGRNECRVRREPIAKCNVVIVSNIAIASR
jgi:hypothetical protein